MTFAGFEFSEDEIEYVTISRDGAKITISKDQDKKKVAGFAGHARPAKPEPPPVQVVREDKDPRRTRR